MNNESTSNRDIAIVGLAGRFPKARNVAEFWRNLCDGVEGISFFTDDELAAAGAPLSRDPNFVKARGVLEEADAFDAAFFGVKPKEAETMDPQHRVFLECAWAALEDAGCDPRRFAGAIGVFAGMSMNTYLAHNLASHPELLAMVGDYQAMLGNDKDFLPTRVSYKLGLTGPSLNIQTACSTSLVAVCVACQHLLNFQCDMALAGAVSIRFPQKQGYLHQAGGIASPDGHCRAFDAKATGTVAGEGVGIVALKRCEDALADGDHIYAVIKGFATNNDGANKVGYTAPSVEGQAEVIAQAQAMAGVEPETIGYIEAHGTGTPLGDPIEVAALTRAFRERTEKRGFCAIGSVKSNVGHLDTAAGVTGLIKAALALKHGKIPPTLHFEKPNPQIDFRASPFFVNGTLREWPKGDSLRRAGVSSFGIGGTNAHVILEEAPAARPVGKSRSAQLLLLSANSAAALERASTNLAECLSANLELNLADVAFTLQTGRRAWAHRQMIVCRDASEAIGTLRGADANRVQRRVANDSAPSVVFMFPGQGTQQVNMGRELYESEPEFREAVDECCDTLEPLLGFDLRSVLHPEKGCEEAATARITETSITQPALFVVEYALAKLWMSWGIQPAAMIGHSIGEYVAACLAGVFSLEDALKVVAERGRLMQQQPAGAMLAVRLPEAELRPLLGDSISLATVNSPGSCVASGPHEAIQKLQQQLASRDIASTVLAASHAFHSTMMESAAARLAEFLATVELRSPRVPFISNVSGTWIIEDEAADPQYWARHLRQTVRFADGLRELLKEPGRVLLEVGPRQTLRNLAKQHPANSASVVTAASLPHQNEQSEIAALLAALGQLWLAGVEVDWTAFYANETRQKVSLPAYPFERTRYWVEPARSPAVIPTIEQERSGDLPESEVHVASGEVVAMTRSADGLVGELRSLLAAMSGLDLAGLADTTAFTEMGFESLFLTQASLAIEKKFGVRIAFRRLLEDANCLAGLAAYVQSQLPQTQLAAVAPAVSPVILPTATEPPKAVESRGRELELDWKNLRKELRELELRVQELVPVKNLREHHGMEQKLNALCAGYICDLFRAVGVEIVASRRSEKADLKAALELRPAYEKFLDYMLSVLAEDGLVRLDGQGIQWQVSRAELPDTRALHEEIVREFPDVKGLVEMLAHCAHRYRQVLAGEMLGVSVLLPDGRHGFFKRRMQDYADRYKCVKRYETLAKELVAQLARKTPLRILEVGAGGGDLTWQLVPELAGCGCEYHFTDISRAFVQDAQTEAKRRGFDVMRFGVLDIAKDPAAQGYDLHSFDLVLGLNVVHATPRVAETLANLNSLLVPGGLLCLVELTRYARWDHMIIGVVEGWWLFEDPLRSASPLMELGAWEAAFEDAGLSGAVALPATPEERDRADAGLVLAQRAPERNSISRGEPLEVETTEANTFPLTASQREIWFASQISDAASCAFNECRLLDLRGALDVATLREALAQVVARHEALRTTILPNGDAQQVHARWEFTIPTLDLSGFGEEQAAAPLDGAQREEATRPFDLVNGPLFRARLLHFEPGRHVLVLTIHHIVCDGHSFGILLQDLAQLYSARRDGNANALAPAVPFRSYAEEQMRREKGAPGDEEFWLKEFADEPPLLDLPADRPRPMMWSFEGALVLHRLPARLTAEAKQFAAREGGTAFTTMLAAWAILLSRLTRQNALVIGVPVAARFQNGAERVVGHCTNLLPVRVAVDAEQSFAELHAMVKQAFLAAHDHQHFTFGNLLQKLNRRRSTNRMPLVSVTLNVERGLEKLAFSGLSASVSSNPHMPSLLDCNLSVAELEGVFELECRFNPRLFNSETVQRWLAQFETLLAAALPNPRAEISSLLPASEHARDTLPRLDRERAGAAEVILPATPAEAAVAAIWGDLLGSQDIGAQDNFFELGGHSLLMTQVLARLRKQFGVQLSMRRFFEEPTVAGLAAAIEERLAEEIDRLDEAEAERLVQTAH